MHSKIWNIIWLHLWVDCIGKKGTFSFWPASLWIKGQSGHCCWGEKAFHTWMMCKCTHMHIMYVLNPVHTKTKLQRNIEVWEREWDSHFCLCPSGTLFDFSGSQILYKNNYPLGFGNDYNYYNVRCQPVTCCVCLVLWCDSHSGVELPEATHTAVSVPCVLFVGEYHRVPNVFFSGVFLPPSDRGRHRWILRHCCFQARGLSQWQHTQKTQTTQTTGSIQLTTLQFVVFFCYVPWAAYVAN